MGRSDDGKKTDRYGKKYSWIAYYEVAGRRHLNATLPDRDNIRISDADIDPSFPDRILEGSLRACPLFNTPYRSPASWLRKGPRPDYRHILSCDEVDAIGGPWVLLQGFITERAPSDPREVFTFLRGLIIAPNDLSRLNAILHDTEYPGNHAISDPSTDYYLFAGEIGWSIKFGSRLRDRSGRAKPQWAETFGRYEQRVIEKRYAELSRREKRLLASPIFRIVFGDESITIGGEEPKSPTEVVKLRQSIRIPGVRVELPSWGFCWESYHSEENQGANAEYPAPSLVDYLHLRKAGSAIDLVDEVGRAGMAYRKFGDCPDGLRGHLLYLRADLLKKYLARSGKILVWINWGERSVHHTVSEQVRLMPAVQQVWAGHHHIHKELLVYEDGCTHPVKSICRAA